MLIVAVVAGTALMAVPFTALAKTTTRIVVASSTTVQDTQDSAPWPVALKAKLQKKSGSRYVALRGSVKVYRYVLASKSYSYVGTKKTSSTGSVSLTIPKRGKYKIVYAGSSAMKASTSFSTVREMIGYFIGEPTVTFNWIDGTVNDMVELRYDLNWNTAAWDGPVTLCYRAWFEGLYMGQNSYDVWVDFDRETFSQGSVLFDYQVDTDELLSVMKTHAQAYVDPSLDPYIAPSPVLVREIATP